MKYRYTGEKESNKKQNIAECIEYILTKQRGDTISTESLAALLGYSIDDEKEYAKFKYMMGKIKNLLVDYGYILKRVAGVGYYILKSKQISGYCYHTYVLKTLRLLEKSDRVLTHIDKTELSEIRMQEFNDVNLLNSDVYESIDNTINDSSYWKNKETYNNLED